MMKHMTESQLNDYVDGYLDEDEVLEVTRHLEACEDCRESLTRLQDLVKDLGSLPKSGSASQDLWAGIATRTVDRGRVLRLDRVRRSWRRISFSLPQVAAAAVLAAVITGGAVWLATRGTGSQVDAPIAATDASSPGFVALTAETALYDSLVADLTRVLDQQRDQMEPETVRIIEENLQIIDMAIDDIRGALVEDPSDGFLNAYLARAMRRKVEVLRHASSLASRI